MNKQRAQIEVWTHLSNYIIFLNSLSTRLSFKTKELNEQSAEKITELNKLNEKLRKTYQEIEKIRKQIIEFQHFEGKFQNLICKNTQNQKEDICTKLLEEKKKKE